MKGLAMSETLVVCSGCGSLNRLPQARRAIDAKCGRCGEKLFTAHPRDVDGTTFDRVTDKDAIEGYIRKYWNLITIQRNANGVIEDLNDITSIGRHA